MSNNTKKLLSYIGLIFVVFTWGTAPLITLELYKYYSPTFRVFFVHVILLIFYIAVSKNHLKEYSKEYLKIGIPTGLFLALADISQKIGLMYTTPTKYAFLENLSCITVPIIVYILTKKKPGFFTVTACFVCLASTFVINGMTFDSGSWGIGEILCGAAGLFYGFNIAGTGLYAKKLHAPLYLATQAIVVTVISLIVSLILHFIKIPNASGIYVPVEKIEFSFNPMLLTICVLQTIIVSGLCWIIRTNSMKHVSATAVSVIMPFSAVVTGILSVITGKDTLSFYLVFGAILGLIAIFMSSYDDIKESRTE